MSSVSDDLLPDIFTSLVKSSFEEKLEVLDAVSLADRFKVAHPLLQRQIEACPLCALWMCVCHIVAYCCMYSH